MAERYTLRRKDHTVMFDGDGMLLSQVVVHLNAQAAQISACAVNRAQLAAVCESIFAAIDAETSSYDEYEAPPQWMTDAYLKLFDLLDKAPAPENPDPSGGDLPL